MRTQLTCLASLALAYSAYGYNEVVRIAVLRPLTPTIDQSSEIQPNEVVDDVIPSVIKHSAMFGWKGVSWSTYADSIRVESEADAISSEGRLPEPAKLTEISEKLHTRYLVLVQVEEVAGNAPKATYAKRQFAMRGATETQAKITVFDAELDKFVWQADRKETSQNSISADEVERLLEAAVHSGLDGFMMGKRMDGLSVSL